MDYPDCVSETAVFAESVISGLERQLYDFRGETKDGTIEQYIVYVDERNYGTNTEGKFRSIPSGWTEALVKSDKPVEIEGKVWHLKYIAYIPNSFEAHWVSDDGEHLIRVSDRWSFFSKKEHKKTGVKKRKLGPRIWSMKQKPHVVLVDNPEGKKIKVAGGYIKFSDMKKIN